MVAVLADVKAAVITRMRNAATITALTSTRIGSVHRQTWGAEPGYMILVKLNGAPNDADWYEVGAQAARLDIEFYGENPDMANHLWQTAHPILCPGQGQSTRHGFTAQGCRVAWLSKEAGPFELIDPVTKLAFTFASYVAVWFEAPIP